MKRLRLLTFLALWGTCPGQAPGQDYPSCAPAWSGLTLVDGETLSGWAVEQDTGSSGQLLIVPGLSGNAIQLNWNIGTGNWVQARCDFSPPLDLSQADLFGFSLRGDASAPANTLSVMFADPDGVFYGYNLPGPSHGINQVDRWLINLPMPKKVFFRFWGPGDQAIDWSRINRLFVVVKRPGSGAGGGTGRLLLDRLQLARAASWPRQTDFSAIDKNSGEVTNALSKAVRYLISQQQATGLLVSWLGEPSPKAWLYDQALALIALSREGIWENGAAWNLPAHASAQLAEFLRMAQKADGHWARGWNPITGAELADDQWVGDQAWCVMALAEYAARSGATEAFSCAQQGAQWLADQIDPAGNIRGVASTEGTVDVWWAMMATRRFPDAERIKAYLLDGHTIWDPDLRYWWRGAGDALIAMDAATWTSAFARHPLVNVPERGKAALSFVRKTLLTSSDDGSLCGLDGQGPVSIWNEGTAQYVAAGGEGAPALFSMLLGQQDADGGMPGSPDAWTTDAFGWLTRWKGVAPTAWLYFAMTRPPFPDPSRDSDGDSVPDWSEFVAGTDPENPLSFFRVDQVQYDPGNQILRLSWQSVLDRFYTVFSANDLAAEWVPVPGYIDLPGSGQPLDFTEDITGSGIGFYKVECRQNPTQ